MTIHCLRRSLVATLTAVLSVAVVPSVIAEDESQPCNPNGQAVDYGDVIVGCTIEVIADLDTFQFAGSAGDVVTIIVSVTSGAGAPCVELRDPGGNLVAGPTCAFNVRVSPMPLPSSGTYTIVVNDSLNNQTLGFNLSLERLLPLRDPTPMGFGDIVTGREIMPVADLDTFSFSGTAGDQVRILVTATGGAGGPCIEVRAPADTPPPGIPVCGFSIDFPMSLTVSGAYEIIITDSLNNQSLTYNIGVNCISGACGNRPPTCLVDPSVVGTTLTLDLTLGTAEPVQWHVALAVLGTTFRLWTVPLPAIDPPFSGPFSIAGFPSLGRVGFLSTLTTTAGIICRDFKTVETGVPGSQLTVDEVERLLKGYRLKQ